MSLFVTIEGIEGCGKSTLQKHLKTSLEVQSHSVTCTREPGGTPLGKKIRELLLDETQIKINQTAELLLFAADRAEHVGQVIKPALEKNNIVICDRFIHSTIAYQGFAKNVDFSLIDNLNKLATAGLTPDLVILLDLDPEIGLSRAGKRLQKNQTKDRFESEALTFHTAVRNGFLRLAQENSKTFVIIDASLPETQVADLALQAVTKFLNKKL
jgi:dTMP kinase